MKRLFISAGLVLSMMTGYAQNQNTEKADKLYNGYQYVSAIEAYLKWAESNNADGYVYKQLADSYYKIFNMEEASKWYAKAVESEQSAETYFQYAQTLRTQTKYKEANTQMDKFASLAPNDQRAKAHKANPDYIPRLLSTNKLFDVAETSINSSDQSDFGPVLSNDNILYFTSTRNASAKKDKWANQPYLDIFQAVRNSDGTLAQPTSVSELNSPFHDGPVAISADGNTLFFARDGHTESSFEKDKKNKIKVGQQGLYKATKTDGKWKNIEALPFNSTAYSVSNPSLSKDGKTLYFASNMDGGLGETDIWKVSVNGNHYGKPENLGATINTPGRESFPFITDENVLYFASSGRQGLGGLDIFKSDLNTNKEATNVGKPVNSEKDDFSFSYNSAQKVGFFASNRNATDNIYSAAPVCSVEAIAIVKDKNTGKLLSDIAVSILDSKGNLIETKQSNNEGLVSYTIDCNTDYTFQVFRKDYEAATLPIPKTASGKVSVSFDLEPAKITVTDSEVTLNSIYFDFDSSNITLQGSRELDKLVDVMKANPNMVIFVKSHADNVGTAVYNQKLSNERAQSTVQYIISKGVKKDRITGKGFGFFEPKIDCAQNCTDEQNALNRRSEFIVVKNKV